jgi:phosphoglycolate phosphatase
MPKIKAIIHDWDDTVTNSFETYSTWYKDFADFYGLRVPELDEVRNQWGQTVPDIIIGVWPEIGDRVNEMFKNFVPDKHYFPNITKGAVAVFESLIKKGFLLGILSSGVGSIVKGTYQKHIDEDFKYHIFVHTQEDTMPYHKPDARVFDKALKELGLLGIKKNEIIYVGDHVFDFKAAENADLGFIAVTTGVNSKNDFIDAGMDKNKILDSFLDIEKVL